ncbi:MAG: hypothetical protein ACYC3I_24165 [Gemmataceae bacterium]
MYPHRIRLRGPWECEPLLRKGDNAEQPLPPSCRMTMPCRWSKGGLAGFNGRVRFRRSFGYPGRIDAHERVWLTFAGIDGEAEAHLNDRPLGRIRTACEFEATSLLRPRNHLLVEIEGTAEQGGLWGEVALEVRCTAFLRDLHYFAILNGERLELRVCGQVVGLAERPLELYVLLDRSVVDYQVTTAATDGQPFEIIVRDLPEMSWRGWEEQFHALPVQVDLVNGAVVWYSHSILVPTVHVETERVSDRDK